MIDSAYLSKHKSCRSRRSYLAFLLVFSLMIPPTLLMKLWFTMVLLMIPTLVMLTESV